MKKTILTILTISLCSTLPAAAEPSVTAEPNTGAALYREHCAACHGKLANTRIPDRSAARIASAIRTLGIMASLKSLQPAQIESIAEVLRSEVESSAGN